MNDQQTLKAMRMLRCWFSVWYYAPMAWRVAPDLRHGVWVRIGDAGRRLCPAGLWPYWKRATTQGAIAAIVLGVWLAVMLFLG